MGDEAGRQHPLRLRSGCLRIFDLQRPEVDAQSLRLRTDVVHLVY